MLPRQGVVLSRRIPVTPSSQSLNTQKTSAIRMNSWLRLLARPAAPRPRRIFSLEGFQEGDQGIAFVGGDRLRLQQRIHLAEISRLIPTTSAKVEVNDVFEGVECAVVPVRGRERKVAQGRRSDRAEFLTIRPIRRVIRRQGDVGTGSQSRQ